MKSRTFAFAALAAAACLSAARAAEPALPVTVPAAEGYVVVFQLDPQKFKDDGYLVDRGDELSGDVRRVGYFLRLTDQQDKATWAFVSMDAFTPEVGRLGVPTDRTVVFQREVDNLEVAGDHPGLKAGQFGKGRIEFWPFNYGPGNAAKVPGAADDQYDFGDAPAKDGGYGSMQVHNVAEKQTIFAYNNWNNGARADLGLGNNPNGAPDWTFTGSAARYKKAELYVLARIDNLVVKPVVRADPAKTTFRVDTDRDMVAYAPGDDIVFTVAADFGDVTPTGDHFIAWTRRGDDGKAESGREKIDGKTPVAVKTSIDRPGFVHFVATLENARGATLRHKASNGQLVAAKFDGGAGAAPDKIEAGAPEPADFDAFWTRQKARLAEVPMKFTMEELPASTDKVKLYAVSVDCAGPRPVTGYLTVPAGAADRSLPAQAVYRGYGVGKQGPPNMAGAPTNRIRFDVNAHGFELGRDDAYYREFAESIKSNSQNYAFDPKQNADPEQAYFNHMVMRVMRSLEFLKVLPQWDGKNLEAAGGSQGGLQTIWAAALDPAVTVANADIPWCCDLAGADKAMRLRGWFPAWVDALGYYDAVNHARRIQGFTTITRAGLGDYTCPPSGVAVLYNHLPAGKRRITWVQDSTHMSVTPGAKRITRQDAPAAPE